MYDELESQAEEMACAQMEHDKAVLSDALYCLGSQMTDLWPQGVDEYIKQQCDLHHLAYPPKQIPKEKQNA